MLFLTQRSDSVYIYESKKCNTTFICSMFVCNSNETIFSQLQLAITQLAIMVKTLKSSKIVKLQWCVFNKFDNKQNNFNITINVLVESFSKFSTITLSLLGKTSFTRKLIISWTKNIHLKKKFKYSNMTKILVVNFVGKPRCCEARLFHSCLFSYYSR